MNQTILKNLINLDTVRRFHKGIIIDFAGPRSVLSTSMLNGGLTTNLTSVFNFNCLADEYDCTLRFASYEEELRDNAKSLELDPDYCSGLSTAAFMECVAIESMSFNNLTVTSIVTAGIDQNAVRVGDPSSYFEQNNHYEMLQKGTINILLHINRQLVPGAMARALSMATEAKTAAIGELMLGSNYSTGIATGSGTDGVIVISDASSEEICTDAGGHSKLGELIGQCVKAAVKEALLKQTAASPARQHTLLERGKRYHITLSLFWDVYCRYFTDKDLNSGISLKELENKIMYYNTNSNLVVFVSTYLNLMDQFQWGLFEWSEVLRESKSMCRWYLERNGLTDASIYDLSYNCNNPIEGLLTLLIHTILMRVLP